MDTDILVTFNAFGVMSVKRQQIMVHITAATTYGMAFDRRLTEDLVKPLDGIGLDETASLAFGAYILEGQETMFVFNELSELPGLQQVTKYPEIVNVLNKAVRLVKKAAQPPVKG